MKILITIKNGELTDSSDEDGSNRRELIKEFERFLFDKREPMEHHNVDKGFKFKWI